MDKRKKRLSDFFNANDLREGNIPCEERCYFCRQALQEYIAALAANEAVFDQRILKYVKEESLRKDLIHAIMRDAARRA